MTAAPTRSRRRICVRRPREQGLTLVELLLSITLVVLLTGFLAGGMAMATRAFSADQSSISERERWAALQTLSDLVGSAIPFHPAAQIASAGFNGRQDELSFFGLSEGRALTGGVYQVVLRRNGNELTADFVAWSAGNPSEGGERSRNRAALLRGVRAVRLRYFGKLTPNGAGKWHDAWSQVDHLPDIVSIELEFESRSEGSVTKLVTVLRQG